MTRTAPVRRPARTGFTLVEMLVVMGLVIVLTGLAVAVAESGAFGSQKVVSAADRASGWLLIAKQRALRDGKPRGVRFLLNANNQTGALEAREAQYVEVADTYASDNTRPLATRPYLAFVYQSRDAAGNPTGMTGVTDQTGQPHFFGTKFPANAQRVFAVFPQPLDFVEFQQKVAPGSELTLPALGGSYRVDQIFGTPQALSVFGGPPVPGYELVLGRNTRKSPLLPPPPAGPFVYPDLGATDSPPSAAAAGPHPVGKVEYNFAFRSGLTGNEQTGEGGPLPLVGEPLLQLTGTTIVIDVRLPDLTPGPTFGAYNPGQEPYTPTPNPPYYPRTTLGVRPVPAPTTGLTPQYFDVLFAPSGQVLGSDGGLVALWVRDTEKTAHPRLSDPANRNGLDGSFDAAGEQVLVTIYPRTGAVATHPVTRGTDPYAAAKDGLDSGL